MRTSSELKSFQKIQGFGLEHDASAPVVHHPWGGALYVHYTSRVRGGLAPEVYQRERARGKAMSVDEAFANAT